jgi:hypothetical protein
MKTLANLLDGFFTDIVAAVDAGVVVGADADAGAFILASLQRSFYK